MKVFKIMGLYLLAAITLTACSKDNNEQPNLELEAAAMTKAGKATTVGYDFDYYGITQQILADIESKGLPNFPLTAADLAYYSEVAGQELELSLDVVNQVAQQTLLSSEMGIKDYMNEKLELKEFTKNTVMSMIENGPVKDLTRLPEFYELPDRDQNVLMATNAVAKNYEGKLQAKSTTGLIVDVMVGEKWWFDRDVLRSKLPVN